MRVSKLYYNLYQKKISIITLLFYFYHIKKKNQIIVDTKHSYVTFEQKKKIIHNKLIMG